MLGIFGKRLRIFHKKGKPDIDQHSNELMPIEPWTPTVAIDKSSPLTIRRNIGNKIIKTVTFANYLYNIDDKQCTLKSEHNFISFNLTNTQSHFITHISILGCSVDLVYLIWVLK